MRLFRLCCSVLLLSACGDDPGPPACAITAESRVPHGSADGHPDPAGARAAKQARAGRITSAAQIRQAPDARHFVRVGDYLMANDKIALYIESARAADGYTPYGGEIVALDVVGEDGLPVGRSQYGESILAIGGQLVAPDRVSVIADGSDGGPAIVRASGVHKSLPFLETFGPLLGEPFNLPVAIDYVLEPGAERIKLRVHLLNTRTTVIDLLGSEVLGFFHGYRGRQFTEETGFEPVQAGSSPNYLAWDSGSSAFAFRPAAGRRISYQLSLLGFAVFFGTGGSLPACQETILDYAEFIPAESADSLRETIRRIDGAPAQREVVVSVRDSASAPVAGATVTMSSTSGAFLTSATTGADGNATVHAPAAEVRLVADAPGYPDSAAFTLTAAATTGALTLAQAGVIDVEAKEGGSNAALPVRVEIIPVPAQPASLRRIVFTETGLARFPVTPGQYRVVVSRGFEYELDDRLVDVAAGATVKVDATLAHSVDTAEVMCADFHIHSFYSVDSTDPLLDKVKGALAEGLDLPISSEHDYVIDFQPVIEQLGMSKWAHAFSSEELTTFTYGHFGVLPKTREEDEPNRGAVEWATKSPAQVFAEVHALPEQPALIVNHPYLNTFQGYFTTATFDLETATGDPSLYSSDFDALEVFNESSFAANRTESVAAWFSLLNHGKRVSSVGSSDSHRMYSTPLGYPRTCLRLGHDDPAQVTANAVRDAVKRGESVVSGGLYMTVEGPGGVRPGGTIPSASGMLPFDVKIQAPGWVNASTLEVFVDGQSVQTLSLTPSAVPGPARQWDAPIDVTVPSMLPPGGAHWVVFVAAGGQDLAPVVTGQKPFAVSNPIYF